MATPCIQFHVLDVGAGSGNFVEYFSDNNNLSVPTATLLFDLGVEGKSSTHESYSLVIVVDRLTKMAEANDGKASIDLLVISHSDDDHHSMIYKLLDYFDKPGGKKPTLEIKSIFYGGAKSAYAKGTVNKYNILDDLKGFMLSGEPTGFALDVTNFSKEKVDFIYNSNGISVSVLVVNTLSTESKGLWKKEISEWNAEQLNSVSLVSVLTFDKREIVITGDATGITMLKINKILGPLTVSNPYFKNAVMITAPHHGSDSTAMLGSDAKELKDNKIVKAFVSLMGAKSITASASGKHSHPSADLLGMFWTTTQSEQMYVDPNGAGNHFYVAYFVSGNFKITTSNGEYEWPEEDADARFCCATPVNVYTTQYFDYRFTLALGFDKPPSQESEDKPKKRKLKSEDDLKKMAIFPVNNKSPIENATLTDRPDEKTSQKLETVSSWTYTITESDNKVTLNQLHPPESQRTKRRRVDRIWSAQFDAAFLNPIAVGLPLRQSQLRSFPSPHLRR